MNAPILASDYFKHMMTDALQWEGPLAASAARVHAGTHACNCGRWERSSARVLAQPSDPAVTQCGLRIRCLLPLGHRFLP